MNTLEFIAALKWPITILILVGFFSWWTGHNPELGSYFRRLISTRNVRLSIAGQELELSGTEDALALAVQSDARLAEATQDSDDEPDREVPQIRRAAVERIMRDAARIGWDWARHGHPAPPDVSIQWDTDGEPTILSYPDLGRAGLRPPRSFADVSRDAAISRRMEAIRSENSPGE